MSGQEIFLGFLGPALALAFGLAVYAVVRISDARAQKH